MTKLYCYTCKCDVPKHELPVDEPMEDTDCLNDALKHITMYPNHIIYIMEDKDESKI